MFWFFTNRYTCVSCVSGIWFERWDPWLYSMIHSWTSMNLFNRYMLNMNATGWIWNFWVWIQNLLENLVQMIYRSSWLVEVKCSWNMAKTQIWLYYMLLIEFWISDFRFRTSSRFPSGWYIDHPYWMRSHFPKMWLKHKYGHSRCHRLNFEFLIGYSESPRKSGQDDV